MQTTTRAFGTVLRDWRCRRRRSQLDVSLAAEISTRHLSCLETGRAMPSRQMIERLSDELDIPLRERNAMYLAAGFAPVHREHALEDLGPARRAIDAVLTGHEPNPALAVNVRWELLAANRAITPFLAGVSAELTAPPLNVLRATLHPDGLAPRIRNLPLWRSQILRRVRRQLERTNATGLRELYDELRSYPVPPEPEPPEPAPPSGGSGAGVPANDRPDEPADDLVVPMILATDKGDLALLYTTTLFGSPRDVTLDEIAIETFFPADESTARILRGAS